MSAFPTHSHTYANTNSDAHTYTYTYTHTYTNSDAHTYPYTHTHAYANSDAHTHAYTNSDAHAYTTPHTRTRTQTRAACAYYRACAASAGAHPKRDLRQLEPCRQLGCTFQAGDLAAHALRGSAQADDTGRLARSVLYVRHE